MSLGNVAHVGEPAAPSSAATGSAATGSAATGSAATGSAATGAGGAAAAGSPQAAQAATEILAGGGNAVDAAIAASAVQCVVEFPWCGLGGDAFLLIRPAGATAGGADGTGGGAVVAVNGSGAAPRRAADGLGGHDRVPRFGPLSIAVPGLVAAWELALARFGTRPLTALLEPAIRLARDGFTADHRLLAAVAAAHEDPSSSPGLLALLPPADGGTGSALPARPARLTLPDLAGTLADVGSGGAEYFYRGAFARQAAAHLAARGGVLSADDLAAHTVTWSAPLSIGYRGHVIYEHPPVSLGSVLLAELRIFEECDSAGLAPGSAGLVDLMVRCKIAAFTDAFTPGGALDVGTRLSPGRARWWRDRLPGAATPPATAAPGGPDTTCLAVRDAAGMTVTMIHSLFNTFGSREVVPGTGVILNDRLASLAVRSGGDGQPAAGPVLEPGKRPLHTLNSYLVVRDGDVVIAGATPGGRGQVQTSFQVLVNLIDKGMSPLDAVQAPRWMHGTPRTAVDDGVLHLEPGLGGQTAGELARLGHVVRMSGDVDDDMFGSCTAVGSAAGGAYAVADGRRGSAARGT